MKNATQLLSHKSDSGKHIGTFKINWDSDIFKGHFPNYPILPGVMLIQLTHELSENIFNCNLQLVELTGIKFLKPFEPCDGTFLRIILNVKDQSYFNAIGLNDDEKEIFKGTFLYKI